MKRLHEDLRQQLLRQKFGIFSAYALKLVGKKLNGADPGPLAIIINIFVNYWCTVVLKNAERN